MSVQSIILFALCSVGAALAADPLPPMGSYKRTCKDVTYDGKFLMARCPRTGATEGRLSRLEVSTCGKDTDIENREGELRCTMSKLFPDPQPPDGPYRESCYPMSYDGKYKRLVAACRVGVGAETHFKETYLDLDQCRAKTVITQVNGELKCQ